MKLTIIEHWQDYLGLHLSNPGLQYPKWDRPWRHYKFGNADNVRIWNEDGEKFLQDHKIKYRNIED